MRGRITEGRPTLLVLQGSLCERQRGGQRPARKRGESARRWGGTDKKGERANVRRIFEKEDPVASIKNEGGISGKENS